MHLVRASKTEQPSCSFANRHCLGHNPHLTEAMENQPLVTFTRHIAAGALGDCVHITGKLPAIIKIEDKTASGKLYFADSRHNLLGLVLSSHWVSLTSHSILSAM